MKTFLDGYKTYIASLVTVGVLYATGDRAGAVASFGSILGEIWPGLLMALMRFITAKTTQSK